MKKDSNADVYGNPEQKISQKILQNIYGPSVKKPLTSQNKFRHQVVKV